MFVQASMTDSDSQDDHKAAANTTQLLVFLDQIKSFYDTQSPSSVLSMTVVQFHQYAIFTSHTTLWSVQYTH